jgi:hypothetical protein
MLGPGPPLLSPPIGPKIIGIEQCDCQIVCNIRVPLGDRITALNAWQLRTCQPYPEDCFSEPACVLVGLPGFEPAASVGLPRPR